MGKSVRQFEPKKARETTPDDLERLSFRETRRLAESGEPLSEEVRKKLTELRTDFVREFEPTMSGENPGIDAFVALLQQEIDWVITRLRSDPLMRNLLLAADEGALDQSRMQALREIKQLVRAGIAKQRQMFVTTELRERAKNDGCSVSKVAEENIISSI